MGTAARSCACRVASEHPWNERSLACARATKIPPCRTCGGILKAATISFGQSLVEQDLIRADAAARTCDLMLAVGTTLGVYPVANVVPLAKHHGARVVIVNAERTEMDDLADVILRAVRSANSCQNWSGEVHCTGGPASYARRPWVIARVESPGPGRW